MDNMDQKVEWRSSIDELIILKHNMTLDPHNLAIQHNTRGVTLLNKHKVQDFQPVKMSTKNCESNSTDQRQRDIQLRNFPHKKKP